MDHRDETTWVAIELTPHGETKVEEGLIESALRRDLGVDDDFPVFIPAVTFRRRERVVTVHLLEGYAFVASGLPETTYYDLERQPYVGQVLSTNPGPHRMRRLSVVSNDRVREMQAQLRRMVAAEIEIGARVMITDGTYRQLDGVVTGLEAENAFVKIELRSLKAVVTVPRLFLETIAPIDRLTGG